MDFLKKILVLKQTEHGFCSNGKEVSGIVRLEIENGVATLYLSLINLKGADGGKYFIWVVDGNKKTCFFQLDSRPQSTKIVFERIPELQKGVACGLVYVKNDIPLLVAFAREDGFGFDKTDLKKIIADKCLSEKRERELSEKLINKKTEKVQEKIETPQENFTAYDDEAVATENYYELDESLNDKLQKVKEKDDELFHAQTDVRDSQNQEKAQKVEEFGFAFPHEKDPDFSQEQPYYQSARKELEELFDKFPPEDDLKRYFPDSKWVKINYSSEKYYIVGVIKENGEEKYICYGMPDKYSEKAPKELDGYCTFIPNSLFDLKGDGYWMIFQDAITGNCIKKG